MMNMVVMWLRYCVVSVFVFVSCCSYGSGIGDEIDIRKVGDVVVCAGCQVYDCLTLVNGLLDGLLEVSAEGFPEGGVFTQVLEVSSRGEEDIDAGDVIFREGGLACCSVTGEGEPKVTELAESYLTASKETFPDTAYGHGEDGKDIAFIVLTAVSLDKPGKRKEVDDIGDLGMGIGFLRLIGLLGVGLQGDRVIYHGRERAGVNGFLLTRKNSIFAFCGNAWGC